MAQSIKFTSNIAATDVVPGKVYSGVSTDFQTVRFVDDGGDTREWYKDSVTVITESPETVQNPDEDVPVCTAPNPAIDHPAHYNQGGIECIDAIRASLSLEAFRGFLKGNQLKYLWRYESKGKAAEDIGKSNWYGAELEKSLKGEPSK